MKKFLLDTNAFFELLSYLAGKEVRSDGYDFADIRQGECFISKITELEILSVIGKYGRGEASQWQQCSRQIDQDGTKCGHKYFHPGRRAWNKKLCRDMYRLVKEMVSGNSTVFNIHVLEVNDEIIHQAEVFMVHAYQYKFGSQDALIAATAMVYSLDTEPMLVVTSDRALRAAMDEEGMGFVVPGKYIG